MLLDEIKGPNDIKKIEKEDYGILAEEIREFLIDRISECGGHLASNLGVVRADNGIAFITRFAG